MKRLALAGLLAAACATPAEPGGSGIGGKADDLGPGEIPAMAGAYALRLDGLYTRCPIDLDDSDDDGDTAECDPDEPTSADALELIGLWNPARDGVEVRGQLTLCRARSVTGGNTLTVADRTLRSLPGVELGGRLMAVRGAPFFAGDPAAIVLGARLDDPFTDALPADGDDPRVIDVDDDGEPGLSVAAALGSVYLSMRAVFELSGPVDATGAIAGAAELDLDQVVYGDSIPFVDAVELAAEGAETTRAVSEDHRHELAPLDASADCDDAVDELD